MCLSYIGGKSRISKFIIPNIPKDIETYVETFGGMFWVFFKMDLSKYPNLKKIVYNDSNPINVNLFNCVGNPERLLEECKKIPVQQKGIVETPEICAENFDKFQKEIFEENKIIKYQDYRLAAKYAYVLSSVFSGANPSKSKFIDLKGKYHSKFTSFMNKLVDPNWQKMFRSIDCVENLDFGDVIRKYDSPTTYFYVDPPYYIVGEGNYYSNHGFGRSDHERLANSLKSSVGRWSLSYYFFAELNEWFPRGEYTWKSKEFAKAASAKSGKKQNKSEELLIMNYNLKENAGNNE